MGDSEVEKFLKGADALVCTEAPAAEVINLWMEGKREESKTKFIEHVSRIAAKTS